MDLQTEYLRRLSVLAKAENERARQIWGKVSGSTGKQAQDNGKLGGRPKMVKKPAKAPRPIVRKIPAAPPPPMSDKARSVNKLLLRKWNDADIADVLGLPVEDVAVIKLKYKLPRSETET
jgi:hypothetical protein